MAENQCFAKRELYTRLKRLIASIKNTSPTNILLRHELRKDLDFDDGGVNALAPHINMLYADVDVEITTQDTSKSKTVRDLSSAIWKKVPDEHKC